MNNFIKIFKRESLPYTILFLFTFILWFYCFRGFISGDKAIVSDAVAYYEHNTFFLDQISRGIYPMWEPGRDNGVPIELYLRRIGSYNPFILMPLAFRMIGFQRLESYLIFLAIYYLLGMLGFYKLAREIFNDRPTAFFCYLILMFSSLATRIFDSYILFTIIPMIWFFYFLAAFSKHAHKHHFLGIILSLMILFTTYVPFFFINIFLTFLILFLVFYWKSLKHVAFTYFRFIKQNKTVFILGLLALLISLAPGILLFDQMSRGEIVVPMRGNKSADANSLSVALETVTSWGMEEDLMYAYAFNDLRKFKFAIVYLPVFSYLVLFLGAFTFVNKKKVFFFLWAFGLLLMFSHYVPIYEFLNQHIFYFRYFRNLHFFLWMIILPVFVLFLGSLIQSLVKIKPRGLLMNLGWGAFLLMVHGLFLYHFIQKDAIISTYITICFSALLFGGLMVKGAVKDESSRTLYLMGILIAIICIQPVEVYHYLNQNYPSIGKVNYRYDRPYIFIRLPTAEVKYKRISQRATGMDGSKNSFVDVREDPEMYMGVKWGYLLFQSLDRFTLDNYSSNRLMAYDRVALLNEDPLDLEMLGKNFAEFENKAYISNVNTIDGILKNPSENIKPYAEIIEDKSPLLQIKDFDVNDLKITTNFPSEKLLVYNTNFHNDWRVYIDGKSVNVYRANFAYLGVSIPAGPHEVHFMFGPKWKHILNYFLLIVFQCVFWFIVVFWMKKIVMPPQEFSRTD